MQLLRSITTFIGQVWSKGCLGKGAVIFALLIVLGMCSALLGGNRRTPATSQQPTIAVATPTTDVLASLATDVPTVEQPTDRPAPTAELATNEPTSAPAVVSTSEPPTTAPVPTAAVIEQPTAALEPSTPPVPQQLPPSYANCQDDPNFAQAPNYPVLIAKVNKETEVVTLKNVSPDAVSLDGWRMCSIKGNQQHPISGSLASGEQRDFPGPAASIWSNSDPDPGALYDSEGRLVSYWKN